MNKLVLFTEGEGDTDAAPLLVRKLITDIDSTYWEQLAIDPNVFRIGGVNKVTGHRQDQWLSKLRAAAKRPGMSGVLALLDGDVDRVEGHRFCAARFAKILASRAKEAGGGANFSVACVFACRNSNRGFWLVSLRWRGKDFRTAGQVSGPTQPTMLLPSRMLLVMSRARLAD